MSLNGSHDAVQSSSNVVSSADDITNSFEDVSIQSGHSRNGSSSSSTHLPSSDSDAAVHVLPMPPDAAAEARSLAATSHQPNTSSSRPSASVAPAAMAAAATADSSTRSLSRSSAWLSFRASVPRQKLAVGKHEWTYFALRDASSPSSAPLLFLPGSGGCAELFFNQILSLGNRGYNVVAVTPPAFDTPEQWCSGLNAFIEAMGLVPNRQQDAVNHQHSSSAQDGETEDEQQQHPPGVHVFANALSGYLCLFYLSYVQPSRNFISSLILCNSFLDLSSFHHTYGGQHDGVKILPGPPTDESRNGGGGSTPNWLVSLLRRAPGFIVRKMFLDTLPWKSFYPEAVDFVVEQLDNLPSSTLASRLAMHLLTNRPVTSPSMWRHRWNGPFSQHRITILDSTDESVIPDEAREKLYTHLPQARYALLKDGGDFPFLAEPDIVNLHIMMHMKALGVFPGNSIERDHEEEELPPAVHITSLPGSDSSSTVSSSPAHGSSSSSSSSSSTIPSSTSYLLRPSAPHPSLGSTAVGYGHPEEESTVQSIFLTKPHSTSTSTTSTRQPTSNAQDIPKSSTNNAETTRSSPSSTLPLSPSAIESHESSQRASLLLQYQQEAAAEAEARRQREKEEEDEAERRERRHQEMIDQLVDEEAEHAGKELTGSRAELKPQSTEDLF